MHKEALDPGNPNTQNFLMFVCFLRSDVHALEQKVSVNSAHTYELNLLGGALRMAPKLPHALNEHKG